MSDVNLNTKIMADAKNFFSTTKKVKAKTKSIGKTFAKLGGAIGAALTVRALDNFIGKLDDIGKHAKRMQVSTDEYQKFSFAAERSGADIANVEAAMKKLNKMINDGNRGLSTAKMAFDELGISFEHLDTLSEADKLKTVAEALDLMTNKGKKATLSQELLARGGLALIPMFKDLNSLFDEASKKGIIDEKSIKAAEELKDMMTNLKYSITSFVTETGLVTFLAEAASGMADLSKEAKKFLDEILNMGNVADLSKLEGGKGPGLNKGYWQTYGEELSDLVTFGYAKNFRKAMGEGEGFTLPSATSGDLSRHKAGRMSAGATAEAEIQQEKTKQSKIEEIKKKQAEAELARAQKTQEANNKKAATEAATEEKKLAGLNLQLALLKARNELDDQAFARKKLDLEMTHKINNAETEKEKIILKQQQALQETLLKKDQIGEDLDNFFGDIDDMDTSKKKEPSMRFEGGDMTDRLVCIGGILGGQGAGATIQETPSEKQRNELLKINNNKMDNLIYKFDSVGGLA